MKYTQMLDMNMVPEWRDRYLDYHALDALLNKAIESKNMKSRERGIDSYFELIKFNQKFASYFSRQCQLQLDKINAFHKEKLSEMEGKYKNLQDQLEQVLSSAIYREIQPDLSFRSQQEWDSNLYNTVNSISELFKNLKDKVSSRSLSSTVGYDTQNGHRVLGAHDRPNVTSIFNGIPRAATKSRRERVSLLASKLSESISSSTQKLTDNLHSVPENYPQLPLKVNRKLRLGHLMHSNLKFDSQGSSSTSIDVQHPQTLAGATPQSKKKIVASYKKKIAHLKFAFRELYFNLVLFEQYSQLNYSGFEQILRKHDRMFASTLGRKFYQEYVQTADFYNDLQTIDQLVEGVEHIYTLHFENGNRRKAIEKLQVPSNVYKPSSPMLDFRVGYELGMFAVLFILVILVGFLSDTDYDWRTVFRLYRSPLVLIIFLFQSGISIVIWKHYKINHVLIFELNPRNNLSFQHFLEFASLLGILWSISVLLFLFSRRLGIRPSVCPLVVVVIIIAFLFNPTATCHYRARFWLIRILVSIQRLPT